MPIRNLWALEPDECIVAEELQSRVKDCQVHFPVHDVGTDLLVARGGTHAGIQVKGSRYYTANRRGTIPRRRWHSWHQVAAKKLNRAGVDFYIFLTHKSVEGKHKEEKFEKLFLVVPTEVLRNNVRAKNGGKKGVYSFYFRFEDGFSKVINLETLAFFREKRLGGGDEA